MKSQIPDASGSQANKDKVDKTVNKEVEMLEIFPESLIIFRSL